MHNAFTVKAKASSLRIWIGIRVLSIDVEELRLRLSERLTLSQHYIGRLLINPAFAILHKLLFHRSLPVCHHLPSRLLSEHRSLYCAAPGPAQIAILSVVSRFFTIGTHPIFARMAIEGSDLFKKVILVHTIETILDGA